MTEPVPEDVMKRAREAFARAMRAVDSPYIPETPEEIIARALIAERAEAEAMYRNALETARTEIEWWATEHGCCRGHEDEAVGAMEEVLRKNPKAAKELEAVKDVIEALQELRRAGVAKGDTLRPHGKRSLSTLKEQAVRSSKTKLR